MMGFAIRCQGFVYELTHRECCRAPRVRPRSVPLSFLEKQKRHFAKDEVPFSDGLNLRDGRTAACAAARPSRGNSQTMIVFSSESLITRPSGSRKLV
jgi:hypothetical protein